MQTEELLHEEYVRTLGPDLGRWFYELDKELDWLRQKWSAFQHLFGQGAERIEVLNIVASNFFYTLRKMLFEDAMLHLCRLTDPPKMGRYQNLSFMGLSEHICDSALKTSVTTAAAQASQRCEFARQWRDKRLAHSDLQTFRNNSVGLPSVQSADIDESIKSLRDVLNLIRRHYRLPQEVLGTDPWGAEALFNCLRKCSRAAES